MTNVTEPTRTPRAWRSDRWWSATGLVALATVLLVGLTDTVSVRDHDHLAAVAHGIPVPWLVQDLGAQDPPGYPRTLAVAGPWENPTDVLPWALLADVTIAVGALAGVWWAVTALRTRRPAPGPVVLRLSRPPAVRTSSPTRG